MAACASDQLLEQGSNLFYNLSSLNAGYLLLILITLSLCLLVYRDYHDFLALGPGGTPSNFLGYLRICYLRLFTLKDPLSPPASVESNLPTKGFLLRLPTRIQPRPSVAGIAPHRQLNQKPPSHVYHLLRIALYNLVSHNSNLLRTGNSCFEKHGLALFLCLCPQCPDAQCHAELLHTGPTHMNATCSDTGEICHLHPSVRLLSSSWGYLRQSFLLPIRTVFQSLLYDYGDQVGH